MSNVQAVTKGVQDPDQDYIVDMMYGGPKNQKFGPRGTGPTYDGRGKGKNRLTPVSEMENRLRESYDPVFYSSLYGEMRYSFGEAWRVNQGFRSSYEGGEFPVWPDLRPRFQEIGKTRLIASASFLTLSKVMGQRIVPEFPQLDKITASVRTAFWQARWDGDSHTDGGWENEVNAAFQEGNLFGLGIVQIVLKTNPKTGLQRVDMEHVPAINVLYDRHNRHPDKWRWICFVKYCALEDAILMWGPQNAKAGEVLVFDSYSARAVPMVRYFEYYDMGFGGGKPTRIVKLGGLGGVNVLTEENQFGRLPFYYYLHWFVSGSRRPVGTVMQLQPIQEGLTELERLFQNQTRQTSYTVYDPKAVDDRDAKLLDSGKPTNRVKLKGPGAGGGSIDNVVKRIQGASIESTHLDIYNMLKAQFNAASGVTDFDQGIQPQGDITLGQNMLVDQRGQTAMSWTEYKASLMFAGIIRTALEIAKDFDRDPVTLDVMGHAFPVNDPSEPMSAISLFLAEPSRVLVKPDALKAQDAQQERIQRQQELLQWFPAVQLGLIDGAWWATEALKALGESDPRQGLPPQVTQAAGAATGQPGAQPQGMQPLAQQPPLQPQNTQMPGSGQPQPISNPAFRQSA